MGTNIRYVCLSDTHFGDDGSLLTCLKQASSDADPSRPSEVLGRLVECLRFLIARNEPGCDKPALVLNGDVLELALATDNIALMAFEQFLKLVLAPAEDQLFSEIICVPGNHDHHVWEVARELQYLQFLQRNIVAGKALPPPWHVTPLIRPRDPSKWIVPETLRWLIETRLGIKGVPISLSYPNFGVFSEDGLKGVVFSHGHLTESIYTLVSRLKTYLFKGTKMPNAIWKLEEENFAWIDFFWSMMGRQGDAGTGVEIVYRKLQNREQRRRLADRLAEGLARDEDVSLTHLGDWVDAWCLRRGLRFLVALASRLERAQTEELPIDEPLGTDGQRGLHAYVSGPLRDQILSEQKGLMPAELTFIFGHTHRPFEKDKRFDIYPEWVDVYNTGGWVVGTEEPSPLHGGAVVLVDEHLDVVSLRMFHDAEDGSPHAVRVCVSTSPERPERGPNSFQRRIAELVDPSADPWLTFSRAAAEGIRVRRKNLIGMMARGGAEPTVCAST